MTKFQMIKAVLASMFPVVFLPFVLNFGHWCFGIVSNFDIRIFGYKTEDGTIKM